MTKTYTPHVHAEVIKAWADGKPVEWRICSPEDWQLIENPGFIEDYEYRIKPEEVVDYALVYGNGVVASQFYPSTRHVYSFTSASHYELRQGFVKRTRIDGKVISFEFIPK
jgi:hypothetical protein